MKRVAALIFHPPVGKSAPEQFVEGGRLAATQDMIAALRQAGTAEILLLTPEPSLLDGLDAEAVRPVQSPTHGFHFGETLQRLIREYRLDGFLYFGSGSGGLVSPRQLQRMVDFAGRSAPSGLFNNFYSCDFAAVSGAQSLLDLQLPSADNPLGFALADSGISCYALPRCLETQYDIDTPIDLLLLGASELGGPYLRRYVDDVPFEHPFIEPVLKLFTERSAHIALLGRVNPENWSRFEREVACRTSGLIEGRGMRAASLRVDPLLHQLLKENGIPNFFRLLANSADGAMLDTRPLLCGRGELPTPHDRFSSDLLLPDDVTDPVWRAFTEEALSSPIPILLGGHSLLSGGLHLISRACWKGRDLPRRLHPEPYSWQ